MAYRFKSRSTTQGQHRLSSGVLGALVSLGDIRSGVGRGDGGVGTLSVGAGYDEGYAAGEVAGASSQLVTDTAAVTSARAGITTSTTLLGVAGTLNLSLYTLISGVVAAGDVRLGTARYSGGPTGTLDLSAYTLISGVASAADVRSGVARYTGGSVGTLLVTSGGVVSVTPSTLRVSGTSFLSRVRLAEGSNVTVTRDGVTIAIKGRPVPSSYEAKRGDAILQAQRMDWLFRAEDYVFDGSACDPEEGDLIQRTIGSRVETYEAQSMDTEGCFQRLDADIVNLRVYTRLVEETTA